MNILDIKVFDEVISNCNFVELEHYKKYTVIKVFIRKDYDTGVFDCQLCLDGLIWVYDIKNFMTKSEYRKIKLQKICSK